MVHKPYYKKNKLNIIYAKPKQCNEEFAKILLLADDAANST